MKYLRIILFLCFFIFQGCLTTEHPYGGIYMSGTYNAGVYPHEKLGDKNAANCAMGIFPYFVFGDLSVYHAAKKAGIDKIHLVEYKMDSTFLWFNKCVYVYGE